MGAMLVWVAVLVMLLTGSNQLFPSVDNGTGEQGAELVTFSHREESEWVVWSDQLASYATEYSGFLLELTEDASGEEHRYFAQWASLELLELDVQALDRIQNYVH